MDSDRAQAELQQLRFRLAVTETLATARERRALMAALLDAMRDAGAWAVAAYWDATDGAVTLSTSSGSELLAAQVRSAPMPEPTEPPAWSVATSGTTLRFPVRASDRPCGVLELRSTDARPRDPALLRMVDHLGDLIGDTLERVDEAQTLAAASRQSSAALRARTAFVATMSHEIRTPLHGVLGLTSLLLETKLDDLQRQYATTAHRAGAALLALLDDVLDLSKIEAGRLAVEHISFAPSQVIDDVVSVFAHVAAERKLALDVRVAPSASASVFGDPTRLRQILFNLVGNAVKFTAAGSVEIAAESVTPGWLQVRVKDTGMGIPAEALPELFQTFSQLDPSVPRRFGGSGLGLSIAQHLANLLGGRISVTSAVGVGSTFTLDVPAAAAPIARPVERTATAPLPKLRVIVVDDQRVNLLIASGMLQRLGQTVTTVSSGREALELAKTEEFDLVFMDCLMPDLDGYETARALRASGFTRPIVAFTARERQFEAHAFRAAGMDDIITKPATQRDIAAVIRRHAPHAA